MSDLNELEKSRSVTTRVDLIEATREFEGPWEKRNEVRPAMFSEYPDREDASGIKLRCVEVRVDRVPARERDQRKDHFRMTAKYRTLDPNRNVLEGGEEINIGENYDERGRGRKWGDNEDVEQSITWSDPIMEYTLRRTLNGFPFQPVFALMGTVNAGPYLGFPRGTVRFLGANARREAAALTPATPFLPGLTGTVGSALWLVEYQFKIRKRDWNVEWRKDSGYYDFLSPLKFQYSNFGAIP